MNILVVFIIVKINVIMKFGEIYKICVPEKKKETDKLIPWLYYVVRPISILITKPLIKTSITPVQVTFLSMITTLIGFSLLGFGQNVNIRILGWIGFFIWAILDCVDGNLARCKGLASERGALWDATGGYLALSLIFFSVGIAAYYDSNMIELFDKHLNIILGGFTSLMSLFPRLIMQKKKTGSGGAESVKAVGDKASFNMPKIIALNLESSIGLMQVMVLFAIIFHFLNLFILFYFFINILITVYSLYTLLK